MNSLSKQVLIKSEDGFMLISVIVLMALSLLVAAGMVSSKATEARIRVAGNEQVKNYTDVEETMSKTVAWLQLNSNNIVGAFLSSNFSNNFDISTPSAGTNESTYFSVPTLIKMKGTTNSVMLSNNSLFGTSAFPNTTNISTGVAFNAVSAFAAADLGVANTRIVLVWAKNTAGHYQPIFRVDTVTGNSPDRGVHSFTFIYSTLVTSSGAAFYSTTSPFTTDTGNNQCASHSWTYSGGTWSSGAARANCILASDSAITVGGNVSGSVLSKSTVTLSGGSVSGNVCQNSGTCHSLSLSNFPSWDTVCSASNQGDLTISSDTTLSVAGNLASQKCWRDVHINSNNTLTLDTTAYPYYFRNLTYQNNSNSKLAFANIPSGQYLTMYVENFADGSFNGIQWFNTNNAPNQIRLNITGTGSYTINGTAVIRADLKAPQAQINLLGNFNYYGGIMAQGISVNGNARLWADEALAGTPTISGINFAQTKASQRYRLF